MLENRFALLKNFLSVLSFLSVFALPYNNITTTPVRNLNKLTKEEILYQLQNTSPIKEKKLEGDLNFSCPDCSFELNVDAGNIHYEPEGKIGKIRYVGQEF